MAQQKQTPLAAEYKVPWKEIVGTGKGSLPAGARTKVHEEVAKRLIKKGTAKAAEATA